MFRPFFRLAMWLALWSVPVQAQDGELVQQGDYQETRNPVTLVAGGNVVGLMSAEALKLAGPFFAQPKGIGFRVAIDRPGTNLCIRVRSRDEDYRGDVAFSVEGARPGWHDVGFDTDYGSYLADLEPDELLVGAFLAPDCDELFPDQVTFAPVTLAENDAGPHYLLANTRNNDAWVIGLAADGTESEVPCEPLDGEMSRSVYQRKCPVPETPVSRLWVEAEDGFGGTLWVEEITIARPNAI